MTIAFLELVVTPSVENYIYFKIFYSTNWGIKVKKKCLKIVFVVIICYILIGALFTILRSNSHYNYFVIEEDLLTKNGKSYWENRCIPENVNNVHGTPGAIWCVDGFNNFHTKKPSRIKWFLMFYSKKPLDLLFLLFLWPIHFIGIDLIHFKSVAGVWMYG